LHVDWLLQSKVENCVVGSIVEARSFPSVRSVEAKLARALVGGMFVNKTFYALNRHGGFASLRARKVLLFLRSGQLAAVPAGCS
jgi:hypothetical protein